MKLANCIRLQMLLSGIFVSCQLSGQELYVLTEPASNMPAHSISARATAKFTDNASEGFRQRYTPEIMFGANKNWMFHGAASFSDMYSSALRWESVRAYAKYRFLSVDEVHKHFRMAAFAEAAKSRNSYTYDELSLQGDHSGMQGGIILTQLWNKLAVSSTLSYLFVTTDKPHISAGDLSTQAFDYSLSAGYLVLPVNYTSFKQTNLNIYMELLGQRSINSNKQLIDLAPAFQLIFNSNTKVNLGYRFQLAGNMNRMADNSWVIGIERTFLNALK